MRVHEYILQPVITTERKPKFVRQKLHIMPLLPVTDSSLFWGVHQSGLFPVPEDGSRADVRNIAFDLQVGDGES